MWGEGWIGKISISEEVSKEVTLILNLEEQGVCSSEEGVGKVFLLCSAQFSSSSTVDIFLL